MKRLLFVWSSAEFSTWDVARGYINALKRTGDYDIREYKLYARLKYHAIALGKRAENIALLTRVASENIVVEAMKHRADSVFIVSGMGLHPDALWLLRQAGIKVTVLFTESPYNDEQQKEFSDVYPEMACFTNERTSAKKFNWRYLKHAYDQFIHIPKIDNEPEYDVLLIGTLWRERLEFLGQVNWTGIKLKLIGTWVAPPMLEGHSLEPFYEEGCVHNHEAPGYYGRAKICINPNRAHPTAESLNPRTYELSACQSFQLTDHRAELSEIFGDLIPTFSDPKDFEAKLRWWLAHPEARKAAAFDAFNSVRPHTFDARVTELARAL